MEQHRGMRTAGGLALAISARTSNGPIEKLPSSHGEIRILPISEPPSNRILRFFGMAPRNVQCACGHNGPLFFKMDFYGEESAILSAKKWKMCQECFKAHAEKHIIRCALCGLGIFPGDGVALYSSSSPCLHLEFASEVEGAGVLGCLRWDCCPSGGFYAGHWTENGFLLAYPNARSATDEVRSTKKTVIVNS